MQENYVEEALRPFYDEGWIAGVLYPIRSGKEATVIACEGTEKAGRRYLAAKVYRPLGLRLFRNDAIYFEGRGVGKARERRAFTNKSDFGKSVQFGVWLHSEFTTLKCLHERGADVPKPVAVARSALLMEMAIYNCEPAPQLRRYVPSTEEAQAMLDRLLRNISLFLALNVVHGDLSPYNILVTETGPVVIDFPQAVDPRANRHALDLLRRDVRNVCDYFERYGVEADPDAITDDLWTAFGFQALAAEL